MKRILYWLVQWTWALPQNVLGLLFLLLWGRGPGQSFHGAWAAEHRCRWLKSGTCFTLGMFIFLGKLPEGQRKKLLVHEYGHTVQSLLLGSLYLPLVFLPSVLWFHHFYGDHSRRGKQNARYSDHWLEKNANFFGSLFTGQEPIDW